MTNLEIILETAFEFLAKKHNVAKTEIMFAYLTGQDAVIKQVNQLIAKGAEVAANA